MKNLITIINLAIIVAITNIFTQSEGDRSIRKQEIESEQSAAKATDEDIREEGNRMIKSDFTPWSSRDNEESIADKARADFFEKMTASAMIKLEKSRTASQRATFRKLKDYGASVMNDQSKMVEELKTIARKKGIKLSEELNTAPEELLGELRHIHGKNFDKKYIKMMMADLKSDVKILEEATRSDDADIQVFGTKYLPVLQSHLDKIKSFKSRRIIF
jgi:putative membrane protein